MAAFQKQLILQQMSVKSVHIEAAGATAAAAQKRTHCSALAGVADGIAEHFVDLLFWGHPPVWVWGTVHPDKLWQDFTWKLFIFTGIHREFMIWIRI